MAKPLPVKLNLEDVAPFVVSCRPGDILFAQGDATRDLWIVDEGSVELLAGSRVVSTQGPGDFFGDYALFHGPPREITARAAAPCQLLRLDPSTFEQLISEAPEIGALMLARVARGRVVAATPPRAVPDGPVAGPPGVRADESRRTVATRGPGWLESTPAGQHLDLPDLPEIRVGRLDPRTGITPEIDLTDLDPDKTVGRRHARLIRRDGRLFVVEDKSTANGTFVNESRIEPQQDVELADGARIRFGAVDAVYRAG